MYINKKKIVCIVLCIWIVFMALGFAISQEQLTITGTTHIDSNWDIRITNITTSDIVGDATEKTAPSYTNTTARLQVSLINPTDSITYNIKIKNLGTLDARIKKINITEGTSDAIEFEVECKIGNGNFETCDEEHFKNQVLSPNAEQTLKIRITFKAGYIGDPSSANKTSTVKLTIDYVQNFEENGTQILPPEDRAYSMGDKITFAGSDWYVIDNSPSSQNYVVVIKENVLTNAELGEYVCGTNTARFTVISPYTSDYATSNVKAAVEAYMASKGMISELIEINGYKIRLITYDELINNLRCTSNSCSASQYASWIISSDNYWTMTQI